MAINSAEIPGQEPADRVLHSSLGMKANRVALLKAPNLRSVEDKVIVQRTQDEITQLNPEQSKKLVTLLFDRLAEEDVADKEDQDKRDTALSVLNLVDLQKLNSQFLLTTYKQSVQKLDKDADPLGSIDSIISAGKKIAPFLPPGQGSVEQISDIWQVYETTIPSNEDRGLIRLELREIYSLIPQSDGESDDLGWRDAPVFEKDDRELHDEYLKTVRDRVTFKLALWENTPDYRRLCEEAGVRLDRFWNLSDPDQVATALASAQNARSPIYEQFLNPSLASHTGLTLDTITPENARVLADEIVIAMAEGRNNILRSVGDPDQARASSRNDADQAIAKFRDLVNQVENIKNPRAQRNLLQQVAGFLTTNGVDVSDVSTEGLNKLLTDTASLETVRGSFHSKVTQRQAAAQLLGDVFDPLKPPSDFSLISRTEQDLFLGDLTGDCTAYHLNVGMNAWTVPIWLTNPGFTTFKIGEGGNLTAKMGLFLATSDKGPTIMIDSIEAGKNITDEEEAKAKIKEGLHYLNQWARRIGFAQVLISNVSNSSELVVELEGVSSANELASLEALGGLSGVAELRKNLIGTITKEKIYIQSEAWVDENSEEYQQREKIIAPISSQIEGLINKAIEKVDAKERERIVSLARSYNGSELMPLLISINFPEWTSIMGKQISDYKEVMDLYVVDEFGNVQSSRSTPHSDLYEYLIGKAGLDEEDFELFSEMEDGRIEPDDEYRAIKETFNKIDEITNDTQVEHTLESLKVMEHFNISLDDVLKRLYKATEGTERNLLALHPRTPLLVA